MAKLCLESFDSLYSTPYIGDIEYWTRGEGVSDAEVNRTLKTVHRYVDKFITASDTGKDLYRAYFNFHDEIIRVVSGLPTVQAKDLPHESGIYLCVDQNDYVKYIGQSTDLANRWKSRGLEQYESTGIQYFLCDDLNTIETLLISIFEPPYNRQNRMYWPGGMAMLKTCYDWVMSRSRIITA